MIWSLFALFPFVAAVYAQSVDIGLPTINQTVILGGGFFTVQVQRPTASLITRSASQNTLSGSEEVAIVIGLQSCPNGPCTPPSDNMGTILYNGLFDPQYHEEYLPPYQNFSVQVPSSASKGAASIGVAHVTLVGAELYPILETLNQTITIT